MIAVADTSPLNYLIQIDAIELLPFLFGQVVVPPAVAAELQHSSAPSKVHDWISHPPDWLLERSASTTPGTVLLRLDAGERDAIQLALELNISTVLIDEIEGRKAAASLGLEVRGTLGILERGAKLGRVNLLVALQRLEKTNFRISPELRAAILKRNQ